MCGRYQLTIRYEEAEAVFDASAVEPFGPRFNIAPTQRAPVVRHGIGGRTLAPLRWGLIPHWAPDASRAARMINARGETITQKPSFREGIQRRRCIVPATGFYEWARVGQTKQPYLINLRHSTVFGMAGLWDRWDGPDGPVESFTVLTVDPRGALDIHDRMPVILSPDAYGDWLAPKSSAATVLDLVRPRAAHELVLTAVSHRVNSVANDDPRCATPVTVQESLL
jgi:putative SOS response-associated peptidase YedK